MEPRSTNWSSYYVIQYLTMSRFARKAQLEERKEEKETEILDGISPTASTLLSHQ